jgi:hypothetical protein
MDEPGRMIAMVAIASVSVFTAFTSGFVAIGHASNGEPRRALRWLLLALGAALLAGIFLGELILGQHSE